jgi:hypothetical protein
VPEAVRELFEAITPRDGSEGDLRTAAGLAPHAYAEIQKLIPLSALLSDEVVEALAEALYNRDDLENYEPWGGGAGIMLSDYNRDAYRSDARKLLQAVIEQVGGAK